MLLKYSAIPRRKYRAAKSFWTKQLQNYDHMGCQHYPKLYQTELIPHLSQQPENPRQPTSQQSKPFVAVVGQEK